jgi:hypothetical protein
MTHAPSIRTFGVAVAGLAEHVAFVVVGFVLIVLGLGLGVTIVMLPVGLPIGLLGLAMVVGGLTVRINQR